MQLFDRGGLICKDFSGGSYSKEGLFGGGGLLEDLQYYNCSYFCLTLAISKAPSMHFLNCQNDFTKG